MREDKQAKREWEQHWGKRETVTRLEFVNTSYSEVVDYLLTITTPKSRCIELGCGSGTYALELIKNGRDCIASDISQKALELTKLKGRQLYGIDDVKTAIVDIYRIPYRDNYFDMLFSDGVIEHLNIPKALKEMKRVTKNGGHVITKVPSGSFLYRMIYKITSPIENRPYEVWHSRLRWKKIFEDVGFKNVKVEWCGSVLEGILNRIARNRKNKNLIPKIGKIYFLIKCQK